MSKFQLSRNQLHWLSLGSVLTAALLFALIALRQDSLPLLSSAITAVVPQAPTGYDPLTEQEQATVVRAAQQAARLTSTRRAQRQGAASAAARQPEVLLSERREATKADYALGNWPRQGDVYLYDYATDTLIHAIVDVQSGAVITVEQGQGVQLPLNEREEQRALALVQADTTLWDELATRYQMVTGQPLTALAQLQIKVSIFQADVMPDQVNAAAQRCGQHRCAQVLLFTVDRTLLELLPIVDLSQGQVVQVIGATIWSEAPGGE
ncbi:MAG: hypothetical protein KF832_27045 [Caldilineaceae bacterium]|nr:hypothetical protein [Caldilineaceae bacterium]